MSQRAPELSRIAILERTDQTGPERVLAFAWGCMHGEVAEYSESGSTKSNDLKVSTSYALLWDLIRWARAGRARWFDLGGVTSGATHSDDPLGGISDFKRRFSKREVEVGQQWELYPHPARAKVATFLSRSADLLRSTTKWMRD
jgi:lipid II:glycine glycyltransferase (peptidoglycan interpeptide bridge formation enzyme)